MTRVRVLAIEAEKCSGNDQVRCDMKKRIAALLLAIALLCLTGCGSVRDLVLDEAKTYEITAQIRSLDIRINAADLKIEYGEKCSVVSNLKNLEVTENNGTLTLKELTRAKVSFGDDLYEGAMLTVYLPAGTELERVGLLTGAGRFTVDTLSAQRIDLELGAGDVAIGSLFVTGSAVMEGGAGRITVSGGRINDFDLEMGVGELDLTAALTGDCELEMGVGDAKITLLGNREDYQLEISKGIGAISVDGNEVPGLDSSGSGANEIEISGGIGAIDVRFMDPKD